MSNVLAIAEHHEGELRDVSFELVTAGRELADGLDGDLYLAVIGGDVDSYAGQLNLEGVDRIYTVANGENFNHDVYVQAVEQLQAELQPGVIVAPHSVKGWDYVPALAKRLNQPLVTDAVDVNFDGDLTIIREMYGSKVESHIQLDADQFVLSIRSGEWEQTETPGDAEVEAFDVSIDESAVGSTVQGYEAVAGGDVDISESDFIVSIGRGIGDEDNLDLIQELAETLGATLASSRPIVDSGWLPKDRQVGQSGKVVTPKVYIAIGISGAVQHVAGMKGSETIIAINNDPDAPIFDIADYGVVGDLFDVVPEIIEKYKAA